MKPSELILHCYAEQKGDQWQAFCLEFTLAAQGDSLTETKAKLENMIFEYVYDALAGEDKAFAEQLLSRRAPLRDWLKYNWYRLLNRAVGIHKELFTSLVPVEPSSHYRHA
jgi:hypothetical protein